MSTPPFLGPSYFPGDHYWLVASRSTEVYHSARHLFLPLDDAAYATWLADDHFPTPIPSEADLREVLNNTGLTYLAEPLPPIEDDRLHVARARVRLVATSFAITSGVPKAIPWTSAPVNPLGMWVVSPNQERITIVQPGWYRIVVGIRFTEGTRTGTRALQVALGLGGAPTDLGTTRIAPALAGNTEFGFTEFAQLATGDILRGFAEQGSGASMNAVARITLLREE